MTTNKKQQKWEYKDVWVAPAINGFVGEKLNRFGKQGWELILVEDQHYIFKRPVHEEETTTEE